MTLWCVNTHQTRLNIKCHTLSSVTAASVSLVLDHATQLHIPVKRDVSRATCHMSHAARRKQVLTSQPDEVTFLETSSKRTKERIARTVDQGEFPVTCEASRASNQLSRVTCGHRRRCSDKVSKFPGCA